MADSLRKLIRHAAAALLIGKTSAGNRVHRNYVDNLTEDELPAVLVFGLNETKSEDKNIDQEGRNLTLIIEARAGAVGQVDDLLDDLSWQCEQLILDSNNLGLDETVLDIKELEFDKWSLLQDGAGQIIHGAGATQMHVRYAYNIFADQTLDDLEIIHTKLPPNGAAEEDAEETRANLPQQQE
jgi:hypothetical protein